MLPAQELNHSFDLVHRLYKGTLVVKLRVFQFFKLAPHNRAMYGRAIRNASQSLMLSRSIDSLSPWKPASWRAWCQKLEARERAKLPLARSTCRDRQLVRDHRESLKKKPAVSTGNMLKRPAAALLQSIVQESRRKPKPTPFSKRKLTLGLARMTGTRKRPAGSHALSVLRRPASSRSS